MIKTWSKRQGAKADADRAWHAKKAASLTPAEKEALAERRRILRRKRTARLTKEDRAELASRRAAKIKANPQTVIAERLRARIRNARNGGYKTGSAVEMLGCSIDDFKAYLEGMFRDGMTWDNAGKWHMDHIIPLSAFDLTDPVQAQLACHYSNYQPLWAWENQSKSGRYDAR